MRRSFTFCSIVVHASVVGAALIAQGVADGALPSPHRPTSFDASPFMPVDIQPPMPRPAPRVRASDAVSPNIPPLVAPIGVAPEPGRERDAASSSIGSAVGAEGVPASSIERIGVAGTVPPPPPEPVAPIRLHSGMKAPVKNMDMAPVYPPIARQAHIHGVVILGAVLDVQGHVESVRILRSIPQLDRAAVEAVRQWRFSPALLNGQPVPVVMTVTVNFTLQ